MEPSKSSQWLRWLTVPFLTGCTEVPIKKTLIIQIIIFYWSNTQCPAVAVYLMYSAYCVAVVFCRFS